VSEAKKKGGDPGREILDYSTMILRHMKFLFWCLCLIKPGISLTIEDQRISPRFTRQVEQTTTADTLKIVLLGDEVSFDCAVESADVTEVSIWWQKDEANLTITEEAKYSLKVDKTSEGVVSSQLTVKDIGWEDEGGYICRARDGEEGRIEKNKASIAVQAKPVNVGREDGVGDIGESMELSCQFEGKPLPEVTWLRHGTEIKEDLQKYEITMSTIADNQVKSLLKILDLTQMDNATYLCHGKNAHHSATAIVTGLVYDSPSVEIDKIVAVSQHKLFINWTVEGWNLPITGYILSFREAGSNAWKMNMVQVHQGSTSYLLGNLTESTEYGVKMRARNRHGIGEYDQYHEVVSTLSFDPVFIPEASIKGITSNSISVGWTDPQEMMLPYIHFYKVSKYLGEQVSEVVHANPNPIHLFGNLTPATSYKFTVSACNQYSGECSAASAVIPGTTYDGLADAPAGVNIHCRSDNISMVHWVDVKWSPPEETNGNIEFYNVELSGSARYNDDRRKANVITVDSKLQTADSDQRQTRFDFLEANTNYSVQVCAVTRSEECGVWRSATCIMAPTPPTGIKDLFSWHSVKKHLQGEKRNIFKLMVPRLSERNGGICCIKVIVVRLSAGQEAKDLPSQQDISITDYMTAHETEATGAYVAEIITTIYTGREIEIGDGVSIGAIGVTRCPDCSLFGRDKRFTSPPGASKVHDGFLDDSRNYTVFVEVVMEGGVIGRSEYLNPIRPGMEQVRIFPSQNTVLVSVLGILAGLLLVALILLVVLYLLRRYSKQVAAQQGVEMDLKHTFRHFCSTIKGRGHSQFLLTQDALSQPDLPPIDKTGMVAAYLERHKDSDYGFQSEFESLPEKFSDRTTVACDLPVNKPKNRYPDIRSYDQTRVKLTSSEEIEGSDYINANFVVGYKERKRWVCAQGPLEYTLADFWRMIQEQGVEIVIMLTNLEEYNRVKCAQYWPGAGTSTYGPVTVAFVQEKRYSDYVVRELKLTVEGHAPRTISHYHYLQWKDFNAPEHAPAMLKFVKRINEAWSGSSPILVHCSAGVGRSGTLIAIDSLTQALSEEGAVSIFQTVSDLRRQRNYLVQSVKQYQFVYRAIMEFAQFGDTEMDASKIKEHWVELTQEKKDGLLAEFTMLANVVDDRKALSVATNAENKSKNGSDSVIPYDRNRVILTPDGARPHSTYINASFIEGYFNDESFIITQDPLEETAMDFWRMVVEHNVATMVMLTGPDSGSWQYWPQDEGDRSATYGCMTVTLANRESRPSYVKREFLVCNTKAQEEVRLTHFYYSEWPGGVEELEQVPSSTHGLLGLVEHALAHQEEASLTGPIAVHCRYGSNRSSIYVGLSVLVQQIKRENRCDVFTAVRKLRAQRQGMIQDLALYEFVYRAISDYVELYSSRDEEYEYSVPVGAMVNNGTAKSAKSVHSAKSNGSGPYCVPVGSATGRSSASASS